MEIVMTIQMHNLFSWLKRAHYQRMLESAGTHNQEVTLYY